MQKFWDGWLRPCVPWFILFALVVYGAGLGWILPKAQPESWNDILVTHLYASHMGTLAGVALWLSLEENETRTMKGLLVFVALVSAILYLSEFWGTVSAGTEIPVGAYLRGGALGASYVAALWVFKYRMLPEFKKLFRWD